MIRYKAYNFYSDDCPVEWTYSEQYEIVVDIQLNKVVCVLTEPEDRTFDRDLKPIIDLLNGEAGK